MPTKRYETRIEIQPVFDGQLEPDALTKLFNELGAEGWRLCGEFDSYWIFQRELPDAIAVDQV